MANIEFNAYVDLTQYYNNVTDGFNWNRKRNILKCEEYNLKFREIFTREDVLSSYRLIEKNLGKFDVKPIHSYEEILDLSQNIVSENIRFYSMFGRKRMIVSGMMFFLRI